MARTPKTTYTITDDLTGEEITEDDAQSISFTYAGTSYELDLSTENANKLNDLLAPYVDAARKVRGASRFPKSSIERNVKRDLQKIRVWAGQNGYTVAPRGVIKKEILDAYDKAH